jgi:hypothetical protein
LRGHELWPGHQQSRRTEGDGDSFFHCS